MFSLIPIVPSQQKWSEYFQNFLTNKSYTLCSYMNTHLMQCRNISTFLIRNNLCLSVIANGNFKKRGYLGKSQIAFIFFNEVEQLDGTLAKIRKYPFWSAREMNYFIRCPPVPDLGFLRAVMETLWRNDILNFVLGIIYGNNLRIFTYDPFLNGGTILNVTSRSDYFWDKLDDLHGHELRISLFEDYPLTHKSRGFWEGDDFRLMVTFLGTINATFRIIEPPPETYYDGSINDLQNNVADMCFISFFMQNRIFNNTEYSYSHKGDGVSVLVPKPKTKFHIASEIFHIFAPEVWLLVLIVLLLISGLIRLKEKSKGVKYSKILFDAVFTFFGYPYLLLGQKHHIVRFLVINFILFAIITRTTFQSLLISDFMDVDQTSELTTIAELKDSNMTLYTTPGLSRTIPKRYGLCSQLVLLRRSERVEMLREFMNTSGAYVMLSTHAKKYIHIFADYMQISKFYILAEVLVPSYDVFIFKKHSPYLDKMNTFLRKYQEYDLSRKSNVVKFDTKPPSREVILKFQHLRFTFLSLILGLSLSFVAFLLELFVGVLWKPKNPLPYVN